MKMAKTKKVYTTQHGDRQEQMNTILHTVELVGRETGRAFWGSNLEQQQLMLTQC